MDFISLIREGRRCISLSLLTLLLVTSVKCESSVSRPAEWGSWGAWSECSRTCGTGVSHRTRTCNLPIASGQERLISNCVGVYRGFQVCNTEPCEDKTDFRSAQCRKFNLRSFGGKRYRWEAFQDATDRCGLTCRAVGYHYHARLADSVVDGTPCDGNDTGQICVAGRCQTVGCDGIVGSDKVTDKCGVCGGENTTCHIISGIFTRKQMPYGYSRVTIIPRGACSINITEMTPSQNYLALRFHHGRYIINGQRPRNESREVIAAGTSFTYQHRPEDVSLNARTHEVILADGPINASIDVLVWRVSENRGILYSYTIPIGHRSHHQAGDTTTNTISQKKHHKHQPHRSRADTSPPPEHTSERPQADQPDFTERHRQYILNQRRLQQLQHQQLPVGGGANQQGYSPDTSQRKSVEGRPVVDSQVPDVGGSSQVATPVQSQPRPIPGPNYGVANTARVQQGVPPGPGTAGYNSRLTHAQQPVYVPPSYSQPSVQSQQGQPQLTLQQQLLLRQQQQRAQAPAQAQAQYGGRTRPQTYSGQYVGGVPSYRQPSEVQSSKPQSSSYAQSYPYQGQPAYGQPNPYQYRYNDQIAPVPHYSQGQYPPRQYPQSQYPQSLYPRSRYPQSQYPLQIGNVNSGSEYAWRITGFTPCSRTCGGGFQNSTVVCVQGATQAIVTDGNCDNALKPAVRSVPCENRPCPPSWTSGEWGSCSTSCDRGQRIRPVLCQQRISNTDQITVSSESCRNQPRPDDVDPCNHDNPCIKWRLGEWSQCSAECGRGQRRREVVCVSGENVSLAENVCREEKPVAVEVCDMGSCAKTWFHSAWSDQCSTECGEGQLTRRIHCGADEATCSRLRPPHTNKRCTNDIPCGGRWFLGPWGECSVTCGEGVIRREVACVKKSGRLLTISGEENCVMEDKPASEKPCSLQPCGASWLMTEWSQCSRTCGTGVRTRELKCLDEDDQVSFDCKAESRPASREACGTESCQASSSHGLPNSQASGRCVDSNPHCPNIAQARLCHYSIYRDICCVSCA